MNHPGTEIRRLRVERNRATPVLAWHVSVELERSDGSTTETPDPERISERDRRVIPTRG